MHRLTVSVPSRFPRLLAAVVLGLLLCIAVFACAPAPVPSRPVVSQSISKPPTIEASASVPQEAGAVVGSIKGQTYHRPDWEWVLKIRPSNLVRFENAKEGAQKGYRPCRSCSPK